MERQPKTAVELKAALQRVTLLALDVDGVLTDGTLLFGADGSRGKSFYAADGLGLRLLAYAEIRVAWITGRPDPAVRERAAELQIAFLRTGIPDKRAALQEICAELGIPADQVAYAGDDWNDLPAFDFAGVRIAVPEAAREVRERADFVTARSGGRGAVRELCEALLDARGMRQECLMRYMEDLRRTDAAKKPAF